MRLRPLSLRECGMLSELTDVAKAKGDSAFRIQCCTCIEHSIAYKINDTGAIDSFPRHTVQNMGSAET